MARQVYCSRQLWLTQFVTPKQTFHASHKVLLLTDYFKRSYLREGTEQFSQATCRPDPLVWSADHHKCKQNFVFMLWTSGTKSSSLLLLSLNTVYLQVAIPQTTLNYFLSMVQLSSHIKLELNVLSVNKSLCLIPLDKMSYYQNRSLRQVNTHTSSFWDFQFSNI